MLHNSLSVLTLEWFQRWKHRRSITSAEVVAELLADLEDNDRSRRHIHGLKQMLRPFAEKFPGRLADLEIADIANYLRELEAGPRRRYNVRNAIVQLFRYARDRDYLPDRRTVAEKTKRIRIMVDIQTWSPDEAKLLLETASEKWRPLIAIGLFAGLRTSEILRLEWSAIRSDEIVVPHRVAQKTGAGRRVPLHKNLKAWLKPYRGHVGPIYRGSFKTNENLLGLEMNRIRVQTGLPRKDNANRHSYGSYRAAILKDFQKVASEMGNSASMVRRHYNDPKSVAEAKEFFEIAPEKAELKIVPMPLAELVNA